MMEKGTIFAVSDEFQKGTNSKSMGKITKYLCYEKDEDTDFDYRRTGYAYEVCCERADGKKECAGCEENCAENKRYYIKYIDISKLKQEKLKLRDGFLHSNPYVHLCCIGKERELADLLKNELIPAYLVPPKYIFDLSFQQSKETWKGTAAPYRGVPWQQVMRECRGSMKQNDFFLLKEKVIFQFLQAIKALHQTPGNLVHRDLKPSNITIEKTGASYGDDLLVSIIDWDWVCIGASANDPFADIAGGTGGFAHPKSLIRDRNGKLNAVPSKRWDFYSAALTIYYILEERCHFDEREKDYWKRESAFALKEMPKTKENLQISCESEKEMESCYIQLRNMLQKLMGEDLEYRNQYQDIQDAIDDFEQYLIVRHGKGYEKDFYARYLLHNSDNRYCSENLMQIYCRYGKDEKEKNRYYVLAERDAVTIEQNGEKIAILYRTGTETLYGFLLSDQWKWEKSKDIEKKMEYREVLYCERTGEELEIMYMFF